MRLTKTVDLTAVAAAQAPQLQFQLSINTEPAYDNVIVEARTVGQDDWTTLPDLNGGPRPTAGRVHGPGFLLALHPFLRTTSAAPTARRGTPTWNSFTGSTGGWQQVAFDLSAYAGQQVEVSISYVTDPATAASARSWTTRAS